MRRLFAPINMITTILTTINLLLSLSGMTLCCHTHADGTEGCVPSTPDTQPEWCETKIQCPNGASRKDPDDECSWSCDEGGFPNA